MGTLGSLRAGGRSLKVEGGKEVGGGGPREQSCSLSLHLGQNHPSCLAYRSKVY